MASKKRKNNHTGQNQQVQPVQEQIVQEQPVQVQAVQVQESRQEKLQRKYKRIWKEKMERQNVRLEDLDLEQNRKRVLYMPFVCIIITLLVAVSYLLADRHCYVDACLLLVLSGVTIALAVVTIYKNRELCQRICEMRAERGEIQ